MVRLDFSTTTPHERKRHAKRLRGHLREELVDLTRELVDGVSITRECGCALRRIDDEVRDGPAADFDKFLVPGGIIAGEVGKALGFEFDRKW